MLQAQRTVEESVVEEFVVIVKPNAAAQRGPAAGIGIPRNAQLRREVLVSLTNRIAEPRPPGVDLGNGTQVTVTLSIFTDPAHAIGDRKVLPDFPVVPQVGTEAIIAPASAR